MSLAIQYFSTNFEARPVSFKEALLKGLSPDRGLYMPTYIPKIDKDAIGALRGKAFHEIAYSVTSLFLKDEIEPEKLKQITADAYNFEVPLEHVYDRKYVMRLDQGPTASFKDFAARMMGRLMQYFLEKENREMLILTATSGDTGSAIANAFFGLDNIKVNVLFPEKEVTERQRKQMTTLQENIQIVSIDGKFDDCQALVKQAFSDPGLDHLKLSSANSINIGRLIPQSIYYFYAWAQLAQSNQEEIIISVPSGNFGNLMGGLIAMHMGLPVKKFIIATNENDEVPVYFSTGAYKTIVPSLNCISSAMNVGHPSNIARIITLYGGVMNEKGEIIKEPDVDKLKSDMEAISVTDEETRETIKTAYKKYKLLLEPHGSVAWKGMLKFLDSHTEIGKDQLLVTLETAHPAKFPQEVKDILGIDPELPESLKGLDDKTEAYGHLGNDYNQFKEYLLKKYSKC
jgi:threonine synthase